MRLKYYNSSISFKGVDTIQRKRVNGNDRSNLIDLISHLYRYILSVFSRDSKTLTSQFLWGATEEEKEYWFAKYETEIVT